MHRAHLGEAAWRQLRVQRLGRQEAAGRPTDEERLELASRHAAADAAQDLA